MAFKSFYNPTTGKIVEYPEHFAMIKPHLVPVEEFVGADELDPCEDCHCEVEPEAEPMDPEPEMVEDSDNMLDLDHDS